MSVDVNARNLDLVIKSQDGDKTAEAELVESNVKLIAYIARKFENTGYDFDDLFGYASLGFLKACRTFDAKKGIKFATYTTRCMENEILMFLRKSQKHRSVSSLEAALSVDWDGNELHLEDVLPDKHDPMESWHVSEEYKGILEAIKGLPDRDRQIIEMRFIRDPELTQKEVAKLLIVSQSYISRLEKRILKRVRSLVEFGSPNVRRLPIREETENMAKKPKVTVQQVKFILTNYPRLTQREIGKIVGLSDGSIGNYARACRSGTVIEQDASIKPLVEAYLAKKTSEAAKAPETKEPMSPAFPLPKGREIGEGRNSEIFAYGTKTVRFQTDTPNQSNVPKADEPTEPVAEPLPIVEEPAPAVVEEPKVVVAPEPELEATVVEAPKTIATLSDPKNARALFDEIATPVSSSNKEAYTDGDGDAGSAYPFSAKLFGARPDLAKTILKEALSLVGNAGRYTLEVRVVREDV